MKETKFEATADSAHGKPLSYFGINETIKYDGTFMAFENIDEVRAKNEMPSDDEILAWANNKKKAAARQARSLEVFKERNIEKPTIENDPTLRLKVVYDGIFAGVKNVEQAKSLALGALGLTEWPADLKV